MEKTGKMAKIIPREHREFGNSAKTQGNLQTNDRELCVLNSLILNIEHISLYALKFPKPPIHFHCVLQAKRGGEGPDSM